ncbi:hypothetical protein [Streptomyces sp. NPDC015414]|uniref:hypothetical protein n=1 Tax=Streptomyces sp. NPDC015414 TaxID=3364957 RepID=UPI0036FC664A
MKRRARLAAVLTGLALTISGGVAWGTVMAATPQDVARQASQPVPVRVSTTPGIPVQDESALYKVDVEGKSPTVYRSAPKPRTCGSPNCDGSDQERADHRTFNWASFRFHADTRPVVTVTKTSSAAGTPTDIRVRGTGSYTVLDEDLARRSIRIRVDRPDAKLSVEFVDTRYEVGRELPLDPMVLFADDATPAVPLPSRTAPGTYVVSAQSTFDPRRAGSADTVVFARGVHDLGYWEVPPSVKRVHLASGAYVRGAVDSATSAKAGQKGFTVTGWGVLSGELFDWRADKRTGGTTSCSYDCWDSTVKMVQLGTDGFNLHDVTVVNAPHWAISGYRDDQITAKADDESHFGGTIEGVKVLGSWGYNRDGIPALPGTTISHCFISAFDDAVKLYSSRATIRDNTLWQMDNGAVFQLGWYGKTISGVAVTDNTLLHAEWTGTNYNWGLLDYAENGGSGTISDVTVSGTRVMGPVTRVVALSNQQAAQAFKNIRLVDTTVDRLFTPADIQRLPGVGDKTLPRNLVHRSKAPLELAVSDLRIGGTRITSSNAAGAGGFSIQGSPALTFE